MDMDEAIEEETKPSPRPPERLRCGLETGGRIGMP